MFKKIMSVITVGVLSFGIIAPGISAASNDDGQLQEVNYQKSKKKLNGKNIDVYFSGKESDEAIQEFLDLYSEGKVKKKDSEDVVFPTFVPNPGNGWDSLGYKDNSFSNSSSSVIKTTIAASIGTVVGSAVAVNYKDIKTIPKAVVTSFSTAVAGMVLATNMPTRYTRTHLFEYYSSYYGKYVYRPVTNEHQTSYRNNSEIIDTTVGEVMYLTSTGNLVSFY
ncbi:hypothetical protein CN378_12735 [Bacillus sp. AFS015802]|uniref:hypothetical protein n=1 Tax=Bacillus sp. AFS015802 TaxID=2033486 RepID=UPI000BF6A736|nr:hypothetical protein [Bacillus sp. AFS015802]PFA66762.1 hypothetical protein CN378_12735 [Bacillus sp. AFS015802]